MSTPLACPHCGSIRLRSDETAVIGYPVRLSRTAAGGIDVQYTGETYDTFDEGTEYRGDIWCQDCGANPKDVDLVESTEGTVTLTVKITNLYAGGEEVTVTQSLEADAPDSRDPEYLRDYWAEEWLFPLTGTGRTEGDAAYFVYVVESSDPELVGMYWEWGL